MKITIIMIRYEDDNDNEDDFASIVMKCFNRIKSSCIHLLYLHV